MNHSNETPSEREARLLAEAEAEFSAEQVSLFQESIQAKVNVQDDEGKSAATRFFFRMGGVFKFTETSAAMRFGLERRSKRIERFNQRNRSSEN